jgi:hypothetical protein
MRRALAAALVYQVRRGIQILAGAALFWATLAWSGTLASSRMISSIFLPATVVWIWFPGGSAAIERE